MGSYGGLRRWFGSRISGPVVVATPSELAAGRGGPEHLWDGGFLGRGRLDRDVWAVGPRRSVMLSCRSWSGKVLTKMRFALFAVGIVAVAVAVVPVSGQVIWSGSENAHFSLSRVAASARSSSSNSWVRLTLFVQLVRIRNRTMSDTISSGGFSSASAYCRSWLNAASRLARRPLYSQAK